MDNEKSVGSTMTGYPSIDKPWLKFYSEEAKNVPLPKATLYEYLWDCNKDHLDDVAIEYFGSHFTYAELFENIDNIALALTQLGIKEDDIVTICSVTTPETIFCIYAIAKIGAIANIVEPRTNAESIAKRINDTHSKLLIILDTFYSKINGQHIVCEKTVVVSLDTYMPLITKIGFKLTKGRKIPKISFDDNTVSWKDFLNIKPSTHIESAKYKENKPVAIIYTSGTTGLPKGAQLTHDSINAIPPQLPVLPRKRGERYLDIMPPFIAYGLVCGIHAPLTFGLTLIIIPIFVPEKFPDYILKYKPNFFMGVPAHYEHLITSSKLKNVDLSFVKIAAMGGDALNHDLELAISEFLKEHHSLSGVYKGYGMTEASSAVATLSILSGEKLGSTGIPLQHNVVSVFEPGTDKELKYGEIGELCITGPSMMYGYLNNEDATKKVFVKHSDGKVWAHTRDIGYIDEDGFIFFKDRIKRMIVRPDGHNVWPSAIEEIINKHPDVKECVVVGLPNPNGKNGKIPTAFIVLKNDFNTSTSEIEKELRKQCIKELPEREVALLYYFIENIPISPLGKVDFRALESGDWEIGEYHL